ncbi:hypothetical protein ID850_02885 [Xenorhabdus sp. Flor]|uniref:hypothetical protein n=1 Tax=Xenorhabdus cabanillasii TaxID=351673 RepID=UPI0019A3DAF8|nr:hypothetical protein [Xenorhabdus sp. Flor]MBD2813731.1 hypothetical protein [Xenorhabdus sp. Flor]
MERIFYNNSEVDMLIYFGADRRDNYGVVSSSDLLGKRMLHSKSSLTLSVTGDYISRFDVIIDREEINFGMALRVLEQEQKIADFFKYEKFVLNFNRINEMDPDSPESFQFSMIPVI